MAIRKISRTEEILARLPKVHVDQKAYAESQERMNEAMAEVRREFRYKSAESERSASQTFFTA